jgi:hypothetical protein
MKQNKNVFVRKMNDLILKNHRQNNKINKLKTINHMYK